MKLSKEVRSLVSLLDFVEHPGIRFRVDGQLVVLGIFDGLALSSRAQDPQAMDARSHLTNHASEGLFRLLRKFLHFFRETNLCD